MIINLSKLNKDPIILEQCDVCGKMVVEEYWNRGCAQHSIYQQIQNIFPFVNIEHDGDRNGIDNTLCQFRVIFEQFIDVIRRCDTCQKRKRDLIGGHTCNSCFKKGQTDE